MGRRATEPVGHRARDSREDRAVRPTSPSHLGCGSGGRLLLSICETSSEPRWEEEVCALLEAMAPQINAE